MKAIIFLIYVLSLKAFMVSPFMVDGISMEPNLHPGELFLINENVSAVNDFSRGDVIVFSLPDDPSYYYVKRIIGIPGDKVKIEKDGLSIDSGNGFELLNESYLQAGTDSSPVTSSYREGYSQTYFVPEGKFFVLGDNREQSLDSRFFDSPFISLSDIRGTFLINLYTYE